MGRAGGAPVRRAATGDSLAQRTRKCGGCGVDALTDTHGTVPVVLAK
jgi:hypothetical protein